MDIFQLQTFSITVTHA